MSRVLARRWPASRLDPALRPLERWSPWSRAWVFWRGLWMPWLVAWRRWRYRALVPAIVREHGALSARGSASLLQQRRELSHRLASSGITTDDAVAGFALVMAAAEAALGMRHHPNQLACGLALLNGHLVELPTGEGKTLSATLPAALAAMAGIPVHVLTVNDYLAERDAEAMMPLYQALGLSVGTIVEDTSPAERARAYACDILYCTNKQIIFDFLKDELVRQRAPSVLLRHADRLQQRTSDEDGLTGLGGLQFAIVDEADSVLLDEARTPFVLSGGKGLEPVWEHRYRDALALTEQMSDGVHYDLNKSAQRVTLTVIGQGMALAHMDGHQGNLWPSLPLLLETVQQALSALHLYVRDRQYLVADGQIQIIDPYTGRVMPDRRWSRGIHQLLELREGLALSESRENLAQLSFAGFFARYHQVAGMSGTLLGNRRELWRLYQKTLVPIGPHKPSRRTALGQCVLPNLEQQLARLASTVHAALARGQAILVGTRDVEQSEQMAEFLRAEGIDCQVLSARHHKDEAALVARAGEPGQVMLATAMAGRGTDIPLSDAVRDVGGLLVVQACLHDAARIDRQLIGRSARQGDPGAWISIVAEDDPVSAYLKRWERALLRALPQRCQRLKWALLRQGQRRLERRHALARGRQAQIDHRQHELLSFSGLEQGVSS